MEDIQDASGNAVAGEFTMDKKMLYFDPTDALSPSTQYSMVLNYCASEEPVLIPFTTSSSGRLSSFIRRLPQLRVFRLPLSSSQRLMPSEHQRIDLNQHQGIILIAQTTTVHHLDRRYCGIGRSVPVVRRSRGGADAGHALGTS